MMTKKNFLAQSYFDGLKHHADGPYTTIGRSGLIHEIAKESILPHRTDLVEKILVGLGDYGG